MSRSKINLHDRKATMAFARVQTSSKATDIANCYYQTNAR